MKTSKKRCISLALAVLMVTVLFAGCGGKGGNAGGKTGDSVTEKLQNVNSYELTLFNSSYGEDVTCTIEVDVENQTFYMVDESEPFTDGQYSSVYGQGTVVTATWSTDKMLPVTLCVPTSSISLNQTLMTSSQRRLTALPASPD